MSADKGLGLHIFDRGAKGQPANFPPTILKAQVPLAGDMSQGLWYNEDRTIIFEYPTEKMLDLMGGKPKRFFLCSCREGILNIIDKAEWQDW